MGRGPWHSASEPLGTSKAAEATVASPAPPTVLYCIECTSTVQVGLPTSSTISLTASPPANLPSRSATVSEAVRGGGLCVSVPLTGAAGGSTGGVGALVSSSSSLLLQPEIAAAASRVKTSNLNGGMAFSAKA